MLINNQIAAFLKEQTCATICCTDETGNPYCFSCFYAINFSEGLLYFKSALSTNHANMMQANPMIAGTVLPDTLSKLLIKGIQFKGDVLPAGHLLTKHAAVQYYKQHPLAIAVSGEIWTIRINYIKMTDSSLGFGKKTIWERPLNA